MQSRKIIGKLIVIKGKRVRLKFVKSKVRRIDPNELYAAANTYANNITQ